MNPLSILLVAFLFSAFAAETAKTPSPKLTPDEVQQMNQLGSAGKIAELESQLAQAKGALAQTQQQVVVLRACLVAKVPAEDCQIQADGSLVKPKTEAPKKP